MRGFSHVEKMMADLGPGATGIIAEQRRLFGTIPRAGHMFNVYVDAAGVVRFADGTADVKLSGFSQLRLFLTNTP